MSNDWKIPLNIAIGVHLLVLISALYLPGIFKVKPKFADIYTVSIVNIAEPGAVAQTPSEPEAAETISKASPDNNKKLVPIEDIVKKPAPSVAPAKAVSLKPLKIKKKKATPPPKPSDNDELIKQRREKLARAIREEELLAEKARLAREALEKERQLLTHSSPPAVARPSGGVVRGDGTSGAAGGTSNIIESQYYASIINRLHQYWALPENIEKNNKVTATVVVTIQQNGAVADMFFESRSGDRLFDQFVTRTLETATPFPPIPPAMKKQRFEVGLVFRPGGVQ
ncbi:energy transducer TonB [Desulforhopalus singaporensis]|uniref:TonB C terminal n=1 Tax=Desulforhopalus singaporensis TaxID=91360 RepID=A0A1H0PVY3_9BACT|nr:TonB family protein [Desulforhopalus singaporensis]SDP09184.1 TonB C terminal [Desulforhopalus singaporensis]